MDSGPPKRKLAAILSADVAGYSRLMRQEEASTVKTLEAYKEILSKFITLNRGRVVDAPGDYLLAEFASVVDAVSCAVSAQAEMQARNAGLPESRRMLFRMGVNLGDVIEDGHRLYGDGVNIADHVQSLADPGGVCISKTVFEHVESKLPFKWEYLGGQKVKGDNKPLVTYKVHADEAYRPSKRRAVTVAVKQFFPALLLLCGVIAGVVLSSVFWKSTTNFEAASREGMSFPLPDVPSIAVLPFANNSDDPKIDLFCFGVTSNIISSLSKTPQIMVIARPSTAMYANKPVDYKQVSESLGVQYILSGSIQKSGDRIRISARLVDALKGKSVWADTFDRDWSESFALQDDITFKVLTSIRAGIAHSTYSPTQLQKFFTGKQGLDCYLDLQKAAAYIRAWNIEDNSRAIKLIQEVNVACPDTPLAYTLLGWAYHHEYVFEASPARWEMIDKSIELAQKAIDLDPTASDPHSLLCSCYLIKGAFEAGMVECEKGVTLNPGSMDALSEYGHILTYSGQYAEAIPVFRKALRINPYGKSSLFRGIGLALSCNGQYEEAIEAYKTGLLRSPRDFSTHIGLTAAYSLLGRQQDASRMAAEVLKLNPRFSLEGRVSGLKDPQMREIFTAALRKAGIPERPPADQQ